MKRLLFLLVAAAIVTACNHSSDSDSGSEGARESAGNASPPQTLEEQAVRLWRDAGFGLAAADEIVDDVYITTDYVYDDRGPNTDDTTGGDSQYPSADAPYHNNAADLVEVRLGRNTASQSLVLGVRLNTLIDDAVPVAAIGINDGSAVSLNEPWPFEAGVSADGVRYVVTLHGGAAILTDLSTGDNRTLPATSFNNTTGEQRRLENTLTTAIPLDAMGLSSPPKRGNWTLHAAAGLWDGGAWAQAPFDLAFLEDTFTNWQQNRQADMLAGGDISAASAEVDFGAFPNRASPQRTGRQGRVYPSPVSEIVGEGIATWYQEIDGVQVPTLNHYRGLYLPYSIWIPPSLDMLQPPLPMFIYMHGASQNHLGLLGNFREDGEGVINVPAFVIAPLGAGELSFYKEEGEIDVLSAMRDFVDHYPVDVDRVFLSGLSMGGQGTFSIGTHRPDLFAAALPFIGTGQSTFNEDAPVILDEEKIPTNRWPNSTGRELLENALDLPFRMANGELDPIVNITWPTQDVQRMKELENDHQFLVFHTRHHEVIPEYMNAVFHQVISGCAGAAADAGCEADRDPGGIVRDLNPARVRYKVVPFHFSERLQMRYEGAYWVSGMQVRDTPTESSFGLIDVTSFALAHKLKNTVETIGPEPLLLFEPTMDTYRLEGMRRTVSSTTAEPQLEATLTNLAAVSIDMERAGLASSVEIRLDFSTDGDSEITLKRLTPGTRVEKDGEVIATVGADGETVFTLGEGSSTVHLR